MGNRGTARRD
uniref:Uncharacterized protein n=1 Tax=Rhizophora mucronata TaxID=61149 RepID=A0A2P2P6M6_RHIMU